MADHPLRPATRRCLGEPLPHQLADRPRDPPEAPEHFLTRPCDPVGISGISPSFLGLFQSSGQVSHVILTRSPLTHVTRRSSAFDLHVLGPPPAFVLSQDQTLRQNLQPAPPKRCRPSNQWCDTTRRCCRREFEVDRDTNPGQPGTGQWWSAETGHRCPFSAIEIVQGLSSDDSRSSGGQPALAFSSSIPFSRST